ncbi:DUF932 domain-containing protein [Massilia sp. YMA4]|uniref:DUF932 domain-containing protein n=1 Tax=[Empedobacter] haloabium TaxID=592317 RepID=A0ABZ1URR0_9BURK|nr:DUF932 domain-containing protein [Massilia sp. YMA4]AXA91319.1 DUF932 domain-containing protein [Massilia sp. YMA4]
MKSGRNLRDLAVELRRQLNAKQDLLAPSRLIQCDTGPGGTCELALDVAGDRRAYIVSDIAMHQLAEKLKIPFGYFERMRRERPELLDENVNTWLQASGNENRLVRTLDGRVRAFLSDRYRRLDNYDVAEFVLPILERLPGAVPASTELTESRMYIKYICRRLQCEVAPGDMVCAGVVVSNSEVGWGHLTVEPLLYRLVCSNGLIAKDLVLRKKHLGKTMQLQEAAVELYKEDTLQADDRAILLKVRDMVEAAVSDVTFRLIVDKLRRTAGIKLADDPVKSVEVLAHRFALSEDERSGVLRSLIEGSQLSGYGLVNAVTSYSQDVLDYDRATELETVGGRLVSLSDSEWREIADPA